MRTRLMFLVLAMLLAPLLSTAQPSGKLPRIAMVMNGSPVSELAWPDASNPFWREFLHRLRELGYEEGKNLLIERRSALGYPERLPGIMAELVSLPVDVIVTTDKAVEAAKEATTTIPIVFNESDPIQRGLVKSLGHPGGNLTGFTTEPDVGPFDTKRLQLLTEALPSIKRVGVLTGTAAIASIAPVPPELEAAAKKLKVELRLVGALGSGDQIEEVLAQFLHDRPDALFIRNYSLFYALRERLAEFVAQSQIPTMWCWPDLENADELGELLSYGIDSSDNARGMADYADKILKGKRPQDLPVQQPMRFYLTVNKKVAQALGIEIPPIILIQATRVIE